MARAEWTQIALDELEAIGDYIGYRDNRQDTAARIVQDLLDKADLYATQPSMGTDAQDLGETFRKFVHMRWLVFYRPMDYGIEVLRVIDGSRDYDELFRSE